MMFTKTYFLSPTSDFIHPPPSGPLHLGSVLRSPSATQYPLNKGNVVPVANEDPPIVETDWTKTISTGTSAGLGVYAQFLKLAIGGSGPEVDAEFTNRQTSVLAFDTMTTLSFEPTMEYIEQAVKAPSVQRWLNDSKQLFASANVLYLVTGMKLVKGAKIKYKIVKSTAVRANMGIDVVPLGMTFGPKGRWSHDHEDLTESTREAEFVFAFRVKRIKFGRNVKVEDYSKGAFMSVCGDVDDAVAVQVEDVDGSDFQVSSVVPDVTEGGNIYCISA